VKVSASTFITWKRCPAAAEARFRGVFPKETKKSFSGALLHRLIARHLDRGPIDDIAQASREEIGTAMNHRLAALGLHRPSQLGEVISEAGSLYQRFVRFPLDGFDGAEVAMSHEPAPGVTLLGKIDAVFREGEGGFLLRDWKSGGLGDPADQLLFYAMLWTFERGVPPAAVEAVSVGTGERYRASPGPAEMQALADEVAGLVAHLRSVWAGSARAPAVGGPWCSFCPLLEGCSEGMAAALVSNPEVLSGPSHGQNGAATDIGGELIDE
jgi:hypothetical protein